MFLRHGWHLKAQTFAHPSRRNHDNVGPLQRSFHNLLLLAFVLLLVKDLNREQYIIEHISAGQLTRPTPLQSPGISRTCLKVHSMSSSVPICFRNLTGYLNGWVTLGNSSKARSTPATEGERISSNVDPEDELLIAEVL